MTRGRYGPDHQPADQASYHMTGTCLSDKPSHEQLAEMFQQDLGVTIAPQALRMFIRMRWDKIHVLAHRIHEGK